MKGRMQKTLAEAGGQPRRDRTEFEGYEGVQTYIWMTEDNIVEVPFDKEHLLETIFSPSNLNRAYVQVIRNKGCGGIDKMSCEQLLPWLKANGWSLIESLLDGSYRPSPVRWHTADSWILHRAILMSDYTCKDMLPYIMSMSNGTLNEEPPYAERHVRWCERSVNTKVGDNTYD